MLLPNRHGNSSDYRYGFNGKEKDDEVKGEGVQYDYGFRVYDARLGKFLSTDPLFKGFPHYSPYQFAGNSPILNIDLDGLEELPVTKSRLVIKNVVIINGKRIEDGATVKVLLNHDFSEDKIIKVKTGANIIKEGYPGSQASYYTNVYRNIARPSLRGVRQFSVERRIDSLVDATSPPPNPKNEAVPKLDTPNKDVVEAGVSTKIKNEPQETINENTINQNQRTYSETVKSVELDVKFERAKPKFQNHKRARRALDPIFDKVKEHPNNRLEITINVQVSGGPETVIEHNWFSKNYLAKDLAADRVRLLRDYIEKYNVDPSKVKINYTIDNSTTYKLRAKLTTFEESDEQN